MEAGSRVEEAKAMAQRIVDHDPKKWSRIGYIRVELPQPLPPLIPCGSSEVPEAVAINAYQFNVARLFQGSRFVGAAVYE